MVSKKQVISVHAPKACKPQRPQFGFFLAGLIDARGRIDGSDVSLCFNEKDASSAYFIKKMIGYGRVTVIKDKKLNGETVRLEQPALRYECSKFEGCVVIADLIRDKLKNPAKIELFNRMCITLEINGQQIPDLAETAVSINNHWLAGFIQGSGCFQIELIHKKDALLGEKGYEQEEPNCLVASEIGRNLVSGQIKGPKVDVKIVIQLEQKSDCLLNQIKSTFGGHIGYRESDETYYYNSAASSLAPKFIKYLDSYQLLATNLTPYWLWRKAYLRVQSKAYLTEKGLAEITRWKNTIAKFWK